MKQLLLQAFNLIRQNPFYATISIIGTAVTIAFVNAWHGEFRW